MELNFPNEIWANVDKQYQISNYGRVKSLKRNVRIGKSERVIQESIINPYINKKTGYMQVRVSNRKKVNVHRLVAIHFCADRKQGLVVNHKDGNKTNNLSDNLEWVTIAQNNKHRYDVLKHKGSCLGRFSKLHPTSKKIMMQKIGAEEFEIFDCALDAVRKYPILDSGSISRCCYGKNKKHHGYTFKFV